MASNLPQILHLHQRFCDLYFLFFLPTRSWETVSNQTHTHTHENIIAEDKGTM